MNYFKLLTWCTLLLIIAGCGGGDSGSTTGSTTGSTSGSSSGSSSGSTSGSSSSSFISWNGNANGTVVKDANNNSIQFRASDGAIYDGTSYYSNLTVSGSDIIYNGSKFGSVTTASSTTGSTIAILECSNGSDMAFSSGTVSCLTGSGSGTGGSSSTGTGGSGTTAPIYELGGRTVNPYTLSAYYETACIQIPDADQYKVAFTSNGATYYQQSLHSTLSECQSAGQAWVNNGGSTSGSTGGTGTSTGGSGSSTGGGLLSSGAVDADGCYLPLTQCVTATTKWVTLFGTTSFVAKYTNNCSAGIYIKFSNQRNNLTWDSGADHLSAGGATSWETYDANGAYTYMYVGSTKSSYDWVCAGKVSNWNQ